MAVFKDYMFHGVKARKIGHAIFERPGNKGMGSGLSLKFIDGQVWFASGSWVPTPAGRAQADKSAAKMRKAGYKARVVELANEIQTFCNKRAGANL